MARIILIPTFHSQYCPDIQSDIFKLMKSVAKWIEDWKNIYKTDWSPISENIQQGLIEKQFVHFDI